MGNNDDSHAPPRLSIYPPLLNSANPWATTAEDLRTLFGCPSTGAVTTRTALLGHEGFPHDPARHQFAFFDPSSHKSGGATGSGYHEGKEANEAAKEKTLAGFTETSSLNSLGYSPLPLERYIQFVLDIAASSSPSDGGGKTFIISVTGTPGEVAECYRQVALAQSQLSSLTSLPIRLAVEINLSCPNIPDKPPPAYDGEELGRYLRVMGEASSSSSSSSSGIRIPWGVKTPPYTYRGQFDTFLGALLSSSRASGGGSAPLSFVTATNTLGSCLLLSSSSSPTHGSERKHGPKLPGDGMGGMAGAALHPLAMGNVATLRKLLDEQEATKHVAVIGVGGVDDADGYRRMRDAGADFVGVGTGLGRKGVGVFGEIEDGLEGGRW